MNSKGQIIVIVLLVTLIALSLGLVVTQKTITDVTTSTQSEQASRAFSAAEAGIEKAYTLTPGAAPTSLPDFGNQATADNIQAASPLPIATQALEYPPIGRETVANFWLTQDRTLVNPSTYNAATTVDLYFGNPEPPTQNPKPAVEITFFYKDCSGVCAGNYYSYSSYYDSDSTRAANNGFLTPLLNGSVNTFSLSSFQPGLSNFYAYKTGVPIYPGACSGCNPILARVRLLYSTTNQKIALAPELGKSLPNNQATAYQATGKAGQSQKSLKVFKESNVVPHFFDFAIFSVGSITK